MGRGIRSGNEWGWERVREIERRTGRDSRIPKQERLLVQTIARFYLLSFSHFLSPQFLSWRNPEAHRSGSNLHQKFFLLSWFISTFLYHHQLFKDQEKVWSEKGKETKKMTSQFGVFLLFISFLFLSLLHDCYGHSCKYNFHFLSFDHFISWIIKLFLVHCPS